MSVIATATAEMVSKFRFSDQCIRALPCRHSCSITLDDGRVFDGVLAFNEIIALINVLDEEQAPAAHAYFFHSAHISLRNVHKCINDANAISMVNLFARMFPT